MMRMHSVSGIGYPGGITQRESDRELMSHVIATADIKMMLRNTAMRPSGATAMGPIAVPAAMARAIRALGKPGRTPTVRAAKKAAKEAAKHNFADVVKSAAEAAAEELSFDFDEFADELKAFAAGIPFTHPRYTRTLNCGRDAFNAKYQSAAQACTNLIIASTWNSLPAWPPPGTINFLSISPITNLYVPVNNAYRANGYYTRNISGTSGAWSRKSVVAKAATIAGPTVNARPNMSSLPRSRRPSERMQGFRNASRDIVVKPMPDGSIGFDGPPTRSTHRQVPTKTEKKTFRKVGALIGAYHKLTEINDLVDALADAIPDGRCDNMPGFAKLVCVVDNFEDIDPVQALRNVAYNEIEDALVGRAQGKLSDALAKLRKSGYHTPNTTQINQPGRTLETF